MKDFDNQLRAALAESDRALLDHLDQDPSLPEMVLESFRGRGRWMVILVNVVMVAMFGAWLYCGIRMLSAESTRELFGWTIGLLFCLIAVGYLKFWYLMELNKLAILREVKRVEMQIVLLGKQLRDKGSG